MMTPLTNTSIAAVAYHNKDGVHIRVYYQEESGDIMELAYDEPGGGWKQTDERGELLRVGRAKIGTGISAAAWDGSSQVRVYYLDGQSQLVEMISNGPTVGSWYGGQLTDKRIIAAEYSNLAATATKSGRDGSNEIHLFYQDKDNGLRGLTCEEPELWKSRSSYLMDCTPGTRITSCSTNEGHAWVYAQGKDQIVREMTYTPNVDEWKPGNLPPTICYNPGASISAVVQRIEEHSKLTLFVLDHGALNLVERSSLSAADKDLDTAVWAEPRSLGSGIARQSDIQAIHLPWVPLRAEEEEMDGWYDALRVYYQVKSGFIAEASFGADALRAEGGAGWNEKVLRSEEVPSPRTSACRIV